MTQQMDMIQQRNLTTRNNDNKERHCCNGSVNLHYKFLLLRLQVAQISG